MSSPKVMELVDSHTGRMVCPVCGSEHYARIKPQSGGRFYRGSWHCVNGCTIQKPESYSEAENSPVFAQQRRF
jgi:hypothetical protein